MAKNIWFIIRDGLSTGPFSDKDLRNMAADGSLVPESPVKRQGSEKIHKAKSIRGLFQPAPDAGVETITIPDPAQTHSLSRKGQLRTTQHRHPAGRGPQKVGGALPR